MLLRLTLALFLNGALFSCNNKNMLSYTILLQFIIIHTCWWNFGFFFLIFSIFMSFHVPQEIALLWESLLACLAFEVFFFNMHCSNMFSEISLLRVAFLTNLTLEIFPISMHCSNMSLQVARTNKWFSTELAIVLFSMNTISMLLSSLFAPARKGQSGHFKDIASVILFSWKSYDDWK